MKKEKQKEKKKEKVTMNFEMENKIIEPVDTKPRFKTNYYKIFETNHKKYFIKVYTNQNPAINQLMAKTFTETNASLQNSQKNPYNLKIINKKSKPLTILLMESYNDDMTTLLKKSFFSDYIDLYKFCFQMVNNLIDLRSNNISGFLISEENVVMDNSKNFCITNLDVNLSFASQYDNVIDNSKNLKKDYAPEFFSEGNYTKRSNVWDLGIFIYKILSNGSSPKIDYENNTIQFNEKYLERESFKEIIEGCLRMNGDERIALEDILTYITRDLSTFNELFFPLNKAQKNHDINKFFTDFNFIPACKELNEFQTTDYVKKKKMKLKTIEKIHVLLSKVNMIDNKILLEIVQKSWKSPKNHITVYFTIKDIVLKHIDNKIIVLKSLIFLHSYIHKSSESCMVVFLENDRNKNIVNYIIENILNHYKKNYNKNRLIVNYCFLLLKKFDISLKYINLIDLNFSIPKIDFIIGWKDLCDAEFITDIFEYSQFLFTFIMVEKQFETNYFEKNIFLFICKEYSAVLGLIVNIFALINYISLYQKYKNDEEEIINKKIKKIFIILENNRRAFDCLMNEKKHVTDIYGILSIDRKLTKKYSQLKEFMSLEKANQKDNKFEIKNFLKNYMNFIARMPDITNKILSKEEALEKMEIDNKRVYRTIIKKFIRDLHKYEIFEVNILKILPGCPVMIKRKVFYERLTMAIHQKLNIKNPKPIEEFKLEPEKSKFLLEKSRMMPIREIKKVNEGIQVQNQQSYEDEISQLKNDIKNLNKKIEEEKNKKSGNQIKEVIVYVDEEVDGDFVNAEENVNMDNLNLMTLEKFMVQEFNSSINEWIIEYNDLTLNDMIASGSTCQVYKGKYRNLSVAIKKIIGGTSNKKIKFLKEFKREISLLVSLPGHSNLLSFLGICAYQNEVYLVTEYCEGGTLFDILYRESLSFKLNYSQKLKIIIDIARGMQFLNELKRPIIHRDLKTLK